MLSIRVLSKPFVDFDHWILKYFRPIDLISLLVGNAVTAAWWFTNKNWILNDIISVCIVVAAVQLLKFTSMRMATLYFVGVLTTEIIISLSIHFVIG